MNQKITKQYIEENMLAVTGRLNCWETRKVKETTEELYLIYHNIEAPKCECGNKLNFNSFPKGYFRFCSNSCAQLSVNIQEMKKTTKLEKYGDENYNNRKQAKATTLERHGDENYSNRKQAKATTLERHGSEFYFQTEEFKVRDKVTKLKLYGDENYSNIEKRKETCLERHGDENYSNRKQAKATTLERHGDENYRNIEKSKETCLREYGKEFYFQTEEFKIQEKATKLEEHGDENYNNREQFKETMLALYGVEHYQQTGLCFKSGYKYKNYIYPSGNIIQVQGYENYLLDELILNYNEDEILTDRTDMPEFWYFSNDNKKHRYFPDVYIPKDNLIYEVKSSYTLEQGKKNGIYNLKMQSVIDAGYDYKLKIY